MKYLILILISFVFCSPAFADKYLVEKPDGSVSIVEYFEGSQDSLDQVLHDYGFEGFPVVKVKDADIPKNRDERDFWYRKSKKIDIDIAKKQDHAAKKSQKQAEKQAVLTKLGITESELKKIL